MGKQKMSRLFKLIATTVLAGQLAGCANYHNAKDPYESFNRISYKINDGLDKAVIKPVATGYNKAVPAPARKGVYNALNNLYDVTVGINDVLQGNVDLAARSTTRVVVNTTFGLLGLFDVAGYMGLPRHENDFDITLAKWGVDKDNSSHYIVWPVFGPSTTRATIGMAVDYNFFSVLRQITPADTRNQLLALSTVDARANLLHVDKTIDSATFDPYVFQRDAYLQHRSYLLSQLTGKQSANGATNTPDHSNTKHDDLYLLDEETL